DKAAPFDEDKQKLAGLDRDKYRAAAERTLELKDCPFRLSALLQQPEGYMRVLEASSRDDDTQDDHHRFARPGFDPRNDSVVSVVSACYWRTVVLGSVPSHVVPFAETADFHAAALIRFVGLFRPGGRERPVRGQRFAKSAFNADFEEWMKVL